jgi:hypothetical protein
MVIDPRDSSPFDFAQGQNDGKGLSQLDAGISRFPSLSLPGFFGYVENYLTF